MIWVLVGGALGNRYVNSTLPTFEAETPTSEVCGGFGAERWEFDHCEGNLAIYRYTGHRGCPVHPESDAIGEGEKPTWA